MNKTVRRLYQKQFMKTKLNFKIKLLFGIIIVFTVIKYDSPRYDGSEIGAFGTLNKRTMFHQFKGLLITNTEELVPRISALNQKLSQLRKKMLRSIKNTKFEHFRYNVSFIEGKAFDFLYRLSRHKNITFLGIEWKLNDLKLPYDKVDYNPSNLFIKDYYNWSVDRRLCKGIQNASKVIPLWAYWPECRSHKNVTLRPSHLDARFVNLPKWTASRMGKDRNDWIYDATPPSYLTYIALIRDAIVTPNGTILTSKFHIIPSTCRGDLYRKWTSPLPGQLEIMEEVFVVSQMWPNKFYHKMVEITPRLVPYLEFLHKHPHIKIHAGSVNSDLDPEWLRILGLARSRFILGTFRARMVYMPEIVYCGFAHVSSIQLTSQMFRERIREITPNAHKDTIIMIRRIKHFRGFGNFRLLETIAENIARRYGLRFWVFSDDRLPTFTETMWRFNKAVLIIAPHGAGLANMIFSEPGTFVIEGLCPPPQTNMCFQRLAHVLGHRFYGLSGTGKTGGCPLKIFMNTTRFRHTVAYYAYHAVSLLKSN